GYADAGERLPDHVAGDHDITQILAPSGDNPEGGCVLDHVAGDGTVGLDIDADPGVVVWSRADRPLRPQVANDIALDHRKPSAQVEVADGDAKRCAVDGVVGDDGALERKFGIKRDLADVADAVADDLDVGGRIAAHRGVIAIADAVAAHDDVAGAKRIDGIAILSGATRASLDIL